MRKFLVSVNGVKYEVEVEEVAKTQSATPKPAGPIVASELKPEAPQPATQPYVRVSDKTVDAPMPGTILSVTVKAGDAVKRGQVLLILEAMKMENEIMAPEDGVVKAVHVSAGAAVDTGSVLVSLA